MTSPLINFNIRRLMAGCGRAGWFLLLACVSMAADAISPQGASDSFLRGADLSALPLFEQRGAVYRDRAGRTGDAMTILRDAGLNLVRLRLFVDPSGKGSQVNDLSYTTKLAQRVKASGAALLLDFHYSDTWADPGDQHIPARWEGLELDELAQAVESYSRHVITTLAEVGVVPEYVQIGNEITGGMLNPIGSLRGEPETYEQRWQSLATLLQAGLRGCRAALPTDANTRFMLHVESPQRMQRVLRWFEQAERTGIDFDIIGISYYPHWHRGLDQLKATLEALAERFPQDIVVVETAYRYRYDPRWSDAGDQHWPHTSAGQTQFLREVASLVRGLPEGKGIGVCYWHPESVSLPDQPVWKAGTCALFDEEGVLLPAVEAFAAPAGLPLTLKSDPVVAWPERPAAP